MLMRFGPVARLARGVRERVLGIGIVGTARKSRWRSELGRDIGIDIGICIELVGELGLRSMAGKEE